MELSETRKEIDRTDRELLSLFIRRMQLSEQIAKEKAISGKPLTDPAREREILCRVEKEAGCYAPYAVKLYRLLFSLSKSRQQEILDSFQGRLPR